ncbi:MAG: GH92 family glycosyl hydrolase [candidate division KSB1 bacterium]|nr:GH92 family glycosyl hydrolase [candidate division KSB1 bacterium]
MMSKHTRDAIMDREWLTAVLLLFLAPTSVARAQDLVQYVNPFIGTGGHGHTYPGASMPFGMVQLSPDTRLEGWDGASGYHYSDSTIYGFSHTHLSGTGVPDYCDILFMPSQGPVYFDNGYKGDYARSYASRFSHADEHAEPGYYRVWLQRHNITAELTVTERAGMHRYTFARKGPAHIILDLLHRDRATDAYVRVVNDHEIEGYRFSTGWARDQRVYFVARFSHPIRSIDLLLNGRIFKDRREARADTIKAALHFDITPGQPILVKVGISGVDIDGARRNLDAEIPHLDFDRVRMQAKEVWNRALGKIQVRGGTHDQRVIFYTALYHSMLAPNLFSDVDGRYRGMDGRLHRAEGRRHYTVFSLWDTFRATHPLFTIIEQQRTREFIQTFMAQYQQGGILPIWELAGNYTGTMIGYHAIPVIVDAYIKGIHGYDAEKALAAMKHSAEREHRGLRYYKRQGFIGADQDGESVSRTLEYAYDDWCIAIMARALGRNADFERYIRRAQFYKNVYDPQTGFMRGRVNGGWFEPFDPFEVNFNYTEANAWQYLFFVPQDVQGLIALMGGEASFERKLDSLFTAPSRITGREQPDITGMIGQYVHGNEPSHHMAYLYNYLGKPWKTQRRVREILTSQYHNRPDGLAGNEDCGQMSSWFVLSAIGLYPVTPGSPEYALTSPLFEEAVLRLENGRTFTIRARRTKPGTLYIREARLNGRPWPSSALPHQAIMDGGELVFTLSDTPDRWWGVRPEHRPQSRIDTLRLTPAPYFSTSAFTFLDSLSVAIACAQPGARIRYTLDGRDPGRKAPLYTGPVVIRDTTVLKARAHAPGMEPGPVVTAEYRPMPADRRIVLYARYAGQYAAGGDRALIDGLRGESNFRTGRWQGYQGQDFEAVVELVPPRRIREIRVGFLQDIGSWIFFPRQVTFAISMDGKNYTSLGAVQNTFPDNRWGAFTRDFSMLVDNIEVRFVRIRAQYYGPCPDWHPGAGGQTWLFLDEIVIR